MKRFSTKAIICVICGFCLSSTVFADKYMNNKSKWMCETNASSASTDAEKKADDMMSKKAMSGKEAFIFAQKHCRDCTKITCTLANESDDTHNTNSNTSNTSDTTTKGNNSY